MMEVDTEKRISVEDALNHPFLKDVCISDVKLESIENSDYSYFDYEKLLNCLHKNQAEKDSELINIKKDNNRVVFA